MIKRNLKLDTNLTDALGDYIDIKGKKCMHAVLANIMCLIMTDNLDCSEFLKRKICREVKKHRDHSDNSFIW